MSGDTGRNRRQDGQARGYVATLSPEGQVSKVIVDMNNLKAGDNLRAWSASARKELTPALTVSLQLGNEPTMNARVPKLALLVASPVVRDYFVKKPTAVKAKFVHGDVSLDAVHKIAQWLKDICLQSGFPELPVPSDFGEALKLRLTMHTLGMERYSGQFDSNYIQGVNHRVPGLSEVTLVIENTRKKDDAILVALANRLTYIIRYHAISRSEELAYANLLASDNKFQRLVQAVGEKEVSAMAKLNGRNV